MSRAGLQARSAILGLAAGLLTGQMILAAGTTPPAQAHVGCPSVTSMAGTSGNDIIDGDGGAPGTHDHKDSIDALSGNDTVEGYSCEDHIFGSLGNDELHGGFGPDELHGGGGDDLGFAVGQGIFLGNGNDFADGYTGQDMLVSNSNEADTDTLLGEQDGFDWVEGSDTDFRDTVGGGSGIEDDCLFDFDGLNSDTVGAGCENLNPG